MKTLLLAGGLGTRLRPITEHTPKPLVLIGDKPLLQYHLQQLAKFDFNDILINTHYLPEKIDQFVGDYKKNHPEINLMTVFEPKLLGSAGTLRSNKGFFTDEDDFLIVYGDNLTDINYQKLFSEHKEKGALVTIACYHEDNIEQKGAVETDNESRITRFVEKPKPGESNSKQANAGIYMVSSKIFAYLDQLDNMPLDFGHHVFPYLLNKNQDLYVYHMTENLLDIGTIETYNKSQELIKNMSFKIN